VCVFLGITTFKEEWTFEKGRGEEYYIIGVRVDLGGLS
jgi:hypothetical protein